MIVVAAWVSDFVRALHDRPWFFKIILRFVFGRYAYREFMGMIDAIEKRMAPIDLGYELYEIEYHKEKQPVRWFKRR